MKRSSIYGVALIVGSLAAVATMTFHQTGHDLLAPADEIARRNEMITVAAHSLALVSMSISLFGFFGFSRGLGLDRPLVSGGLIAYGFGSVAAMCAAVASGLIAPVLTRRMLAAGEAEREPLHLLLMYNFLINQGFAKVFVVASSIAVVLWSASLMKLGRFARVVGVVGCFIALGSLASFLAGHLRLNVHGFGLFIFAQSAWIILLGLYLCRSDDSLQTPQPQG